MKTRLAKFAFVSILIVAQSNFLTAQDRRVSDAPVTASQNSDSRFEIVCPADPLLSEKAYQQAKEFLEKSPNTNPVWKKFPLRIVAQYETAQTYEKWQKADNTFFSSPNLENLNKMIEVGELYLEKLPALEVEGVTRLALAAGYSLLADFYHDTNRTFSYAEKSLRLLEPEKSPSRDWSAELWKRFRAEHRGRLWQFQGLAKLRQPQLDLDAAIALLTKAAEAKDGLTFKDPNTYILRAEAYTLLYTPLRDEYNESVENQARRETAREKLYPVIENLVADYARIIVLTEKQPDLNPIYNEAKANFTAYLKASSRYDKLSEDDVFQLFRKELDLQ